MLTRQKQQLIPRQGQHASTKRRASALRPRVTIPTSQKDVNTGGSSRQGAEPRGSEGPTAGAEASGRSRVGASVVGKRMCCLAERPAAPADGRKVRGHILEKMPSKTKRKSRFFELLVTVKTCINQARPAETAAQIWLFFIQRCSLFLQFALVGLHLYCV